MPVARDFRFYAYQPARVVRCGRSIGRNFFWKLYAIENSFRVIVNSVLIVQVDADWWAKAISKKKQATLDQRREDYTARPLHASPGKHDIYLLMLSDLTKLIGTYQDKFSPVVPDIDEWIVRLERIRLPRNLVGHMNFPNSYDRQRIDSAYASLPVIFAHLHEKGIPLVIP